MVGRSLQILFALVLLGGVACDESTPPPGDAKADAPRDFKLGEGKTGDGQGKDGPQTGDGVKPGDGPKAGDGVKPGDGPKPGDGVKPSEAKPAADATPPWFLDGANPNNKPACFGKVWACGDGLDNDGDKLVDALDPDCTGPCDNSEGSFEIAIPGANMDNCKQDCYWDDDSGDGNDGCAWTHKCDPKDPSKTLKCPYDASYTGCPKSQSALCLSTCLKITPNGCDCFGCCEIWTPAGKYKDTVFLGSGPTCTAKTPQNCFACTQVKDCLATCGPCQLCLGKTPDQIPAWCYGPQKPDGGPPKTDGPKSDAILKPDQAKDLKPPWDGWKPPDLFVPTWPWCPLGVTPCLTNAQCPPSYYCITGCCKLAIF
jgi:hypothetical protein